jgi:Tol biopolymer transport system component
MINESGGTVIYKYNSATGTVSQVTAAAGYSYTKAGMSADGA